MAKNQTTQRMINTPQTTLAAQPGQSSVIGGNGGVLFRIYHTMTSDATITHTGGALGTGGAGIGGGNAGASGTVGNAGETISIVI